MHIEDIVDEFPSDIRMPIKHLVNWIQTARSVTREDFSELKMAIQELTVSQTHTEEKVQRLVEAQEKTDKKLETLTDGLQRLAEAQEKTEKSVQRLAETQEKTDKRVQRLEDRMETGFKSLSDQIAALGSRWGIYNEGTFRSTIHGILKDMEGIRVEEGEYGNRQVDVIIRNGEHVMLEITSRMHSKDIGKLYRSADDYRNQTGISPKLMVATSYVSPRLMQTIMGLERPIEIFSYESEAD